jgi:hypothetical protein
MDRWRRYAPALQEHMKKALQQVAGQAKLSNDVREVVSKALAETIKRVPRPRVTTQIVSPRIQNKEGSP